MAHLDKSLDCHDLDQLVVDCRWLYPKFNQVSLVSSYKAPVLASFFFPEYPGYPMSRSQIGRYYSTTMKMSQDSLAWTMRTFLQHKSHKNTASNHQPFFLLLDHFNLRTFPYQWFLQVAKAETLVETPPILPVGKSLGGLWLDMFYISWVRWAKETNVLVYCVLI